MHANTFEGKPHTACNCAYLTKRKLTLNTRGLISARVGFRACLAHFVTVAVPAVIWCRPSLLSLQPIASIINRAKLQCVRLIKPYIC